MCTATSGAFRSEACRNASATAASLIGEPSIPTTTGPEVPLGGDHRDASVGVRGDVGAHRAEEQPLDAAESARTDDDHGGVLAQFQEHACRVAVDDRRRHGDVGGDLLGRIGGRVHRVGGVLADGVDDVLGNDEAGSVVTGAGVVRADDLQIEPFGHGCPCSPPDCSLGRIRTIHSDEYRVHVLAHLLWSPPAPDRAFASRPPDVRGICRSTRPQPRRPSCTAAGVAAKGTKS